MPAKKSPKKEYPVIKGYKAFNKDMTCKEFTYEEGKEYEIKEAIKICVTGFHFCTNPLDCLGYYDLIDSNFHEVESLGETQTHPDDSKVVTNRIKIGAKLDLRAYIKASFDFLWESCNNKEEASGESAQLAASGDSSQLAAGGNSAQLAASGYSAKLAASGNFAKLAASGYSAKLAASGDSAKLAASGYSAQLAASGDSAKLAASGYSAKLAASGDSAKLAAGGYSAQLAASGNFAKLAASGESAQLAASGDSAKLELTGGYSVGAGIGINNKIKAKKGDWITLAEWRYDDNKYIPLCVKSAQVDGTILKEDVWYVLREGEFKEV